MNKFTNKLTSLIEVKKIIALLVTIVFCVMAFEGSIPNTEFLTIFSLIIGYYFGASGTRQAINLDGKSGKQ